MSNEQCVHHWVIDQFNVGRCIKCPAVRDFGALMKKQDADIVQVRLQSSKRGRKKKQATSGGIASVTMSR